MCREDEWDNKTMKDLNNMDKERKIQTLKPIASWNDEVSIA